MVGFWLIVTRAGARESDPRHRGQHSRRRGVLPADTDPATFRCSGHAAPCDRISHPIMPRKASGEGTHSCVVSTQALPLLVSCTSAFAPNSIMHVLGHRQASSGRDGFGSRLRLFAPTRLPNRLCSILFRYLFFRCCWFLHATCTDQKLLDRVSFLDESGQPPGHCAPASPRLAVRSAVLRRNSLALQRASAPRFQRRSSAPSARSTSARNSSKPSTSMVFRSIFAILLSKERADCSS
jgi:hypothetical protein